MQESSSNQTRPTRLSMQEIDDGWVLPEEPAASKLIDVNAASFEELRDLPGIGPSRAKRIVAARDATGRFADIDALRGIKGIGPKIFAQLAEHVRT